MTPPRACQIVGITSDFKMEIIKVEITPIRHDNLLRHNSVVPLSLKTFSFLRKALLRV